MKEEADTKIYKKKIQLPAWSVPGTGMGIRENKKLNKSEQSPKSQTRRC